MSFEVTVAGVKLPTDSKALKDLRADLNLAFQLEAALAPFLNAVLAMVPDTLSSKVSYTSPKGAWTPLDSVVSFNLQGGASGALDIVKSGNLLTYMDGLDSPKQVQVPVPAGHVYVRLTLQVQISAGVAAKGTFSGGAYGVTASADTQDSYAITFCKAFVPTVTVGLAIAQTFQSFVLPFRAQTLKDLGDGDYLTHDFDGNLNLAVGAYAGLDKVFYAGQGSADVLKAFGNPAVKLSASVKPEVKLAASMDFKMTYATRFQAMLSKVGKTGRLHLFKSSKVSTSTTVSAGLTINLNATVDVKEQVISHLPDLKSTLVNAAGGPDSAGGKAVGFVVGDVITSTPPDALQKYIDEATDKLTSWLNRANGEKCNLQVAIESTRANTLLAGYTFALDNAGFDEAWGFAIKGDLYAALNLQSQAMTLDVGSGLEKDYQAKTSFQCNFFNLWNMNSWSQFSSSSSMVYAGNNVFHMIAKVGRTTETDYVGAKHAMDIYFAASADANASGTISKLDVTLNIAMNASNDRKQIQTIATMLSMVDRSDQIAALVRDMRAFSTNTSLGSAQLLFQIPGSCFAKIQSDAKNGPEDAANWQRFADAAEDLDAWPLHDMGTVASQFGLRTYSGWKTLNMNLTGAAAPDRTQFGTAGNWPEDWSGISDTSTRARVRYSMLAGQQFMNFCAALQALAQMEAISDVTTSWEAMLKLITKAIKEDLGVDFLRPSALATVRMCKGNSYVLTGPAAATIPADHFAVAVVLV